MLMTNVTRTNSRFNHIIHLTRDRAKPLILSPVLCRILCPDLSIHAHVHIYSLLNLRLFYTIFVALPSIVAARLH